MDSVLRMFKADSDIINCDCDIRDILIGECEHVVISKQNEDVRDEFVEFVVDLILSNQIKYDDGDSIIYDLIDKTGYRLDSEISRREGVEWSEDTGEYYYIPESFNY